MKRFITLFGFTAILALLFSCDEKNSEPQAIKEISVEWTNPEAISNVNVLIAGTSDTIEFKSENVRSIYCENVPENWEVSPCSNNNGIAITVPATADGADMTNSMNTINIVFEGDGGKTLSQEIKCYAIYSFDDPNGAFVLNEGNMTTENGSLIYITPEGYIVDDVYKKVNGTELGNVCQDMAFFDSKIYIISQNGDENPVGSEFQNDGMLVILDAKTLKKIDSYKKEELSQLSWPSHIAVLDEEHVYIRDNGIYKEDDEDTSEENIPNGRIWRLNTKDRSVTLIKGTSGAPKSRFVKVNNKLYTHLNGFLIKLLEISADSDEAKSTTLSYSAKKIYGLCASEKGELWTISQYQSNGFIYYVERINEQAKMERVAKISYEPNTGASGSAIAAWGDYVYYAYDTSIFQVDANSESSEEASDVEIIDVSSFDKNARELYNNFDINPENGNIFINSIKAVGNFYTTNHIWVFNPDKGFGEPLYKFSDHTRFPAGTFFINQNK